MMNAEQIVQWYKDEKDQNVPWDAFEKMPSVSKLHESRRIAGINKLASLMKEPWKFDFGAEHDEVNFYVGPEDLADGVTEDDMVYLTACGIHYSSEDDAFYMFC